MCHGSVSYGWQATKGVRRSGASREGGRTGSPREAALSHNHHDHCDRLTLRRLAKRFDPLVVTPLGNGALVRSTGLRRVEELDWWGQSSIAPLPITLTPARHFSARTPFDRNKALWGGFMLAVGAARVFFAGDSAYATFFREIRQRVGPPDLALLPIGAYEPRWFIHVVHMNPEEAVQAHVGFLPDFCDRRVNAREEIGRAGQQPAAEGGGDRFAAAGGPHLRKQRCQVGIDFAFAHTESSGNLINGGAVGQQLECRLIPRRDMQHQDPPFSR